MRFVNKGGSSSSPPEAPFLLQLNALSRNAFSWRTLDGRNLNNGAAPLGGVYRGFTARLALHHLLHFLAVLILPRDAKRAPLDVPHEGV